jgi:integrase
VAAGVGVWSPHRIRHARATELAEAHGIETTAVVLGHADIRSTQVYVEKRPVVATELMRLIG